MPKNATVNVAHARNKKPIYEKIVRDKVCPFCVDFSVKKDVFEYHTKPVIIHGEYWAVTENFNPYKGAKHHFLIIHRGHIVSFSELMPAALAELTTLIRWLEERFKMPAGVLLFRFGDTNYTGGSVDHFHAHFVLGAKRSRSRKDQEPLLLYAGYRLHDK